jgi:hypothetical protein
MRAFLAAFLLLLAVSPVSAPFLTYDLAALLGDAPPAVMATPDAKKVSEDALPLLNGGVAVQAGVGSIDAPHSGYRWRGVAPHLRPIPLRL